RVEREPQQQAAVVGAGGGAEEHGAQGAPGVVQSVDLRGAVPQAVVEDLGQQVLLAADVPVDEAEVDAGGLGDVAQRHPRSARGDLGAGGPEDRLPDPLASGGAPGPWRAADLVVVDR